MYMYFICRVSTFIMHKRENCRVCKKTHKKYNCKINPNYTIPLINKLQAIADSCILQNRCIGDTGTKMAPTWLSILFMKLNLEPISISVFFIQTFNSTYIFRMTLGYPMKKKCCLPLFLYEEWILLALVQ